MYSIVYADPPWTYNDKGHSGKRGVNYKYETMSLPDIQSMSVSNICNDNAALFMWVTGPLLQEGLDTIKAWGFDYKGIAFVWVKTNPKAHTDFMGMGNYTRSNAELCLLGVRGKIARENKGVRQIIATVEPEVIREPIGKHSAKPPLVRHRITKLLGDLSRIELFARENPAGWHTFGNETDSQPYITELLL